VRDYYGGVFEVEKQDKAAFCSLFTGRNQLSYMTLATLRGLACGIDICGAMTASSYRNPGVDRIRDGSDIGSPKIDRRGPIQECPPRSAPFPRERVVDIILTDEMRRDFCVSAVRLLHVHFEMSRPGDMRARNTECIARLHCPSR
jgi:hypothetical protein